MTRRLDGVAMAVHWTGPLLVFWALVKPGPASAWALAIGALAWIALAVLRGLHRPGPKLGRLRDVVRWGHGFLIVWLSLAATLSVLGHPAARPVLLLLMAAATIHALFNIWRGAILGDGAFRTVLPKAIIGD
ncbi:MAG: hypothetical protein AAF366_00440 [Pseudomonadota bacterium]